MKKLKKKQKGITLIALVISIIVMLILAGVSLNLTIGDNGIIKQAQNASIQSGIAVLQEFLQEKYVENYDSFSSEDINKVAKLSLLYQDYFYNPQEDGYGTVNYVLDSEGHALYLINKSGLPQDIRDMLNGGECGRGKTGTERYMEYLNLVDVYGVTSDLTVYYSYGDGSFLGVDSSDKLDSDTTSRPVLSSSNPLTKIVKGDGTPLTVADVQSVKNLTIDSASGVTSLSDLYVFTSLENLTLVNLNLSNLDGIQLAPKLNYVYMQSCIVNDGNNSTFEEYKALSNVSKLKYLYFYDIDDLELEKICQGIKDANYSYLEYFAVVGKRDLISSTRNVLSSRRDASKYITNLEPLSMLSSSCVGRVKYLSLQCNDIGDTTYIDNGTTKTKYALENLVHFSKLYLLRVERNKLTSLKGLGDKKDLCYLFAGYNNLGINETYIPLTTVTDATTGQERTATDEDMGKNSENAIAELEKTTNLYYLNLKGNLNLKWVSYLANDTAIEFLYFGDGTDSQNDCINMVDTEVAKIGKILSNCGSNKSVPSKYWLSLLDSTDTNLSVNLNGETITKAQFRSLGNYSNINSLNLENVLIKESDANSVIVTSREDINSLATEVLSKISNLQYLNLSSSTGKTFANFNDLTFLKGINANSKDDDILLRELDALNTLVSTKQYSYDTSGNIVKDSSGNIVWNDYDNGLKLLNSARVSNSGSYYANLKTLCVNEENINLATIKETIKALVESGSDSKFYSTRSAFWTNSAKVYTTISNCNNFNSFKTTCTDLPDAVVDLTNCTGLNAFTSGWQYVNCTLKLPVSCKSVHICGGGEKVDLSRLTRFDLTLGNVEKADVVNILGNLNSEAVLTKLGFRLRYCIDENDTNFDIFREVYNIRKSKLKVLVFQHFQKDDLNYYTPVKLVSLSGFEYLDGLESINLIYENPVNLKDISALSNFSTTLQSIYLPDFSISDATVISSLTALKYLDLSGNCLAPYIEISSTEGNEATTTKWYTIKEICSRMSTNAGTGKVTLKLAGNSSITDWSYYTNKSQYWDSDSNYGN